MLKNVVLLLLVMVYGATAVEITGIVVDRSSREPVAGVRVELQFRGVADTTDEAGYFRLSDVAVHGGPVHYSQNRISIGTDGRVNVSVCAQSQVETELYSLDGRRIAAQRRSLSAGNWTLSSGTRVPGVYIVQARQDNAVFRRRISMPSTTRNGGILNRPVASEQKAVRSARRVAASGVYDTIVVSKPGYTTGRIAVSGDHTGMEISLDRFHLDKRPSPGRITGATTQGKSYAIVVGNDGGSVDSFSIDVVMRCPSSGGTVWTFGAAGPFPIGDDGTVHIGDSITIAFTDSMVRGTFFTSLHPEPAGRTCVHENWVLYNTGWRMEGYAVDVPQRVFLEDPVLFSDVTYTLVASVQNGTINRYPDRSEFMAGERVALAATPSTDYHFAGWSGDTSFTRGDSAWVIVNANATVTARCELNYALTVNQFMVERYPAMIRYPPGETVRLVAQPGNYAICTGWTGDTVRTSGDTAWVVMNGDRAVDMIFTTVCRPTFTAEHGTVRIRPQKEYYLPEANDTVLVWVDADSGYRFRKWVWTTDNPPVLAGSAATDDTLRIVMNTSPAVTATFLPLSLEKEFRFDSTISAAGITRDGSLLITLGRPYSRVSVISCATGDIVRSFSTPSVFGSPEKVILSPDGERMLIDAFLSLSEWSMNGDSIAVLNIGNGAVGYTCYSDDGGMILSCCGDSTIRIWSSPADTLLRTLAGFSSAVQCAAWSHDGGMVASVSGDSGLQLWETATGTLLRTFPRAVPATWPVRAMKLLPDNSRAVLVTQVGDFYIVSCDDGNILKTYNPEHSMQDVAFTDDCSRFALGTWGGRGGIYRISDGTLIESFDYFDAPIISVGFFSGDTRAYAIAMDGTGLVWKL